MGRVFAFGVLLILAGVGCHTITEEPPREQTVMVTGPNPVIVNPPPGDSVLVIPGPTQPPAPQQSPNPAPSPNPPPSTPPSQPNMNPAANVYVSVTSFLRNGHLNKGGAGKYLPGDVLYLTCTPKDGDNKPTKNHGPIQGWTISSGNLGGGDYYYTDTDTFNPDVHVSPNSGAGSIEAKCRVDDIGSNTLSMPIVP